MRTQKTDGAPSPVWLDTLQYTASLSPRKVSSTLKVSKNKDYALSALNQAGEEPRDSL
jgi:hypothetical protein